MRIAALAALLVLAAPAAAQTKLTNDQWIDRCVGQLMDASGHIYKGARSYCKCMQETVENNESISQTEMERKWPPAHLNCRKRSGRK